VFMDGAIIIAGVVYSIWMFGSRKKDVSLPDSGVAFRPRSGGCLLR